MAHHRKQLKRMRIAVVGATGTVGRSILSVLWEYGVPSPHVFAIASNKSKTKMVTYGEGEGDQTLPVQGIETFDFSTIDIAFFAIDNEASKKYAPIAAGQGALVIDKSSHFRLDPDVPLIIPEVNPTALSLAHQKYIIANPNCSTIQLVLALKPIHDINPIQRIIVSTYQSVSGAGNLGMDILYAETKAMLMNQPHPEDPFFPKPIAFNVIPQIDDFTESGDTKEELKMRYETQKILDRSIRLSATCVRVPVFIGHAMAVNLELSRDIHMSKIMSALQKGKGLKITAEENIYQTPIEVAQEDAVYVSRIREDTTTEHGLSVWIACDNTRKGAALNGVQIADLVCRDFPDLIRNG